MLQIGSYAALDEVFVYFVSCIDGVLWCHASSRNMARYQSCWKISTLSQIDDSLFLSPSHATCQFAGV